MEFLASLLPLAATLHSVSGCISHCISGDFVPDHVNLGTWNSGKYA
jgi:hypothetical protein